jgi:cobyrinic acid a,c-diamide synthase
MLRAGVPAEVPWLGAIPRFDEAALPSRHLGLVQAEEIADLDRRLDAAAARIGETALADRPASVWFPDPPPPPELPALLRGRRIAVARDAAFSFLYADNLRLLEALGATVTVFSPLAGDTVDADAVYLPGGYPELHLGRLAENTAMKRALARHLEARRPLYAECGGMLYLLQTLTDKTGVQAPMAGLLPGHGRLQPRLAGLGMQALDLPEGRLRGHGFHHSTMETPIAPSGFGIRQHGSHPGEPFYRHGPLRASYLHLYFPSAPAAAAALFLPD